MLFPKGVQHKPFADEECKVLLVEPKVLLTQVNC